MGFNHEGTTMAKHQIKHRWNDSVLFECDVPDGMASGPRTRYALERAVESHAYLSGANLSGAYLSGANLSDANLSGANLSGANLSDANLSGAYLSDTNLSHANLSDANLSDTNLSHANLSDANLSGASLSHANLSGANLSDTNLSHANLSDANLSGASLSHANLSGAKWRDGIVINKPPIQLFGLHWRVTMLDEHMQIGCELHKLSDWAEYDDERIARMDGRNALRFWRAHKDVLLGLAKSAGRGVDTEPVAESA